MVLYISTGYQVLDTTGYQVLDIVYLNQLQGARYTHISYHDNFIFQKGRKKIISQFCWIGKDCDQNGDRMSKNDENLPCFALDD